MSMPAEDDAPRITLLGPQREPRLDTIVEALGLTGRHFATITAGWRDREGDDGLLRDLLGGRTTNLRLWNLMQQVWDADPELEQADRERRATMSELQSLYNIGLEHAADALYKIRDYTPRNPWAQDLAVADALDIVSALDARHLARVEELHQDFYDRHQPQYLDAVVTARFAVGQALRDTDAIVITGGHVGVLLGLMHMFNLAPGLAQFGHDEAGRQVSTPRLHRPIIAWGAGAMVLTERVLLFYDDAVQGPDVAEMLMKGLGLTRDIVALPSSRERLDLKNVPRMAGLVSRLAPAHALLLDERVTVTLEADGRLPAGARILGAEGTATTYQPAPPDQDETGPASDASYPDRDQFGTDFGATP